ncbi:sodium:proton antiporter [Pseudoxanthomonas yeongjuensis]|uniref:cation:proton antiporter n=1 Tax=Pseudoxanthomonas yeongjuensis TaxID=377616 RepID=UPI001391848A|nr:cation:proton antiporter [Pseudoxanthomonas yeongjuensis]KAF1717160.1 sodium:proton antiporter [Pseudoxanthomonas yeongjuensis]
MHTLLATTADALIFLLLAWGLWRLLGRSIPIAVIPIIIGLVLAATGWLPASLGVPSVIGDGIGWAGVLLLAFAAGLETRQSAHIRSSSGLPVASRGAVFQFVASAALALLLPFVVGALAAYHYFSMLPDWTAPNGDRALGAIALGLCIAVSALPVLIGIVRELGPLHRPLTQMAVRIAVFDDAVLWIGLALLLFASGDATLSSGSPLQMLALAVPVALVAVGATSRRRNLVPPRWAIWLALPVYLVAGSWASSRLGLHALLGAYFAGAMLPPTWTRQLPVERIGRFALLGLAPLFFGHSGLKIDGDVLGWASLQASLALLAVSVVAKLAAVLICPPTSNLSRREALSIGALLQCKGLMEIVAAAILRDKGLLSEHAFAALVTLAVLSTLLTGPFFRFLLRRPLDQPQSESQPV